jgi:hypothetical protein
VQLEMSFRGAAVRRVSVWLTPQRPTLLIYGAVANWTICRLRVERLMNAELENIGKEAILIEGLSRNSSGGTEKNQENRS